MTPRFKLLAAALGLVIATGAIGDVSAKTIAAKTIAAKTIKPVAVHTVAGKTTKTMKIAGKHHRVHLTRRGTTHAKLAHSAKIHAKIAHRIGLKHVATAMNHRTGAKAVVVR